MYSRRRGEGKGEAKTRWRQSDYRDQAEKVDACTLISSKIQLNYFAIAARPCTMLVSDIYEKFVTRAL